MPVDKIRYFPPLGWGITQKGVGEYFEDYPTFVYKADVGGFQEKKSVYIATWVKTAFVTQCTPTPTANSYRIKAPIKIVMPATLPKTPDPHQHCTGSRQEE